MANHRPVASCLRRIWHRVCAAGERSLSSKDQLLALCDDFAACLCLEVVNGCNLRHAVQATKLIMDHMCKEPFEILWWPVVALVLLLANSRAQLLDTAITSWGFAAVMIVGYLYYITAVINEICGFLGIHCLTIKPSAE